MSFKREGDDPSQLNVLKKRRVADLLANYIPEDEAILLRDGRYACTVCFHRPVFDTLDMLTVHRSGKKHLASLQKFYGKKRSLENEVQKRHHQAYLQAEEAGAQQLISLNLPREASPTLLPTQVTPGPAPLLVQTKKIAQSALLKTAPYNSCCQRSREAKGSTDPSPARTPSGFRDAEEAALSEPWNSAPVGEDRAVGVESAHPASLPRPTDVKAESQEESALGKKQRRKRKAPPGAATPSGPDHLTPEKRQALEHYLRLKSSGWVQDGSGKWVKDENVEFDSDEEEPPALTLS